MACFRIFMASVVVLGVFASANLFAEDKPPISVTDKSSASDEAAIEKALQQPAELVFDKTPLSKVVSYIQNHHSIPVNLDRRTMEDIGLATDAPVTINLRGASLQTAIEQMGRNWGLTWTIMNGVLLITTPEEDENNLVTKLYDVADLVLCRDSHGALWDDYEPLTAMIPCVVHPITWEDVGGPGSVVGATIGTAKILIVTQTYRTHGEVSELLLKIREIAKKNANAGPPLRDRPPAAPARPQAPYQDGVGPFLGTPQAKAEQSGKPTKTPSPGGAKGQGIGKGMF